MQFPGQEKPPIGIAFDTALGNGIDDILALAMLYGLEGKSQARLISCSTTKSSLRSAALGEALAKFYSGPPPAPGTPAAMFQRPAPPIGMAESGKMPDDTPILKAVLDKKNAEGKPVYTYSIQKLNDTADPVALIRNAFTAQSDGNCLMVLAGPATTLARMLDYPGNSDLIKRKVKFLAMVTGANLKADLPAAKRLLAEWPTPIVAADAEIGAAVPFPGTSIEKDFGWTPDHPVVDAYRAFRPMPYDAPAPTMAAMLYAVHPEGYFKVSEPGTFTVQEDGRIKLTPSGDGKHRMLVADAGQKEKVLQTYVEMTSAKPAPRPQRFRGPQKKDQAAPAKAPDPIKKQ